MVMNMTGKISILTFILSMILILSSCDGGGGGGGSTDSWTIVKNNASVTVHLTSEYNTPSKLNIATMGWEDGINISRDGLHIYTLRFPLMGTGRIKRSGTDSVL